MISVERLCGTWVQKDTEATGGWGYSFTLRSDGTASAASCRPRAGLGHAGLSYNGFWETVERSGRAIPRLWSNESRNDLVERLIELRNGDTEIVLTGEGPVGVFVRE